MNVSRLRRRVWLQVETIGFPGLIGLGLIAYAAMFYLSADLPAMEKLGTLRQNLLAAQTLKSRAPGAGREDAASKLNHWYRLFPLRKTAPDWLAKVYAAARGQALMLRAGKYHVILPTRGNIGRYQWIFPVNGSDTQIRAFINEALRTVPAMALDAVAFKRENVGDTTIEATIKFSLYFRVH